MAAAAGAPAYISEIPAKLDSMRGLLKTICRAESIPFGKCKKITSWLEAQITFLQERPAWNIRGVMGGLKRMFGGTLPTSGEMNQLRGEITWVAERAAESRGEEVAAAPVRKAAPRTRRPSAKPVAAPQVQPPAPAAEGFILMQVPIAMVSAVLQNGGTIAAAAPVAPAPAAPVAAPPRPLAVINKQKPRVDTKKMTPEERHAHAARLTNPTTIYVPEITRPSLQPLIQPIIDQLLEKGLRISSNEKQYRYAVANKHRNAKISVKYTGSVEEPLYAALVAQGIKVETETGLEGAMAGLSITAPAAGAGGEQEWGEMANEDMAGGVTPQYPPMTPTEDDDEDDDEETRGKGIAMDFWGCTFYIGDKVTYEGKEYEVISMGTSGLGLRNSEGTITIDGPEIEKAVKIDE